MHRFRRSLPRFIIITACFCPVGALYAGALDKYGEDPPATKAAPATKQDSREAAINRAVRSLASASPEERKKLLEEYRKRAKQAMDASRYDEARFYTDILKRAEN